MEELVLSVMVLGIVISSFLFVGWVIWLLGRLRRERQERDVELRSRMLEKFGSSDEFVQFMQTDAGRRFLDTAKTKGQKNLRTRVASSLATGAIFIMLSVAFFFLTWSYGEHGLMFPGAILGAIGVGLAVSALIYFRLGQGQAENGS